MKASPIGDHKVIQIEVYIVPKISPTHNKHAELAKGKYRYPKGLWFSNVCKEMEELEIDVLASVNYLWNFERNVQSKED